MSWLVYLGTRRPEHLGDQGMYAETVSRPRAEPRRHRNPAGIEGHEILSARQLFLKVLPSVLPTAVFAASVLGAITMRTMTHA